jgi:MFS transporter, AAHS family, benzoate transport protein
MPESPTWLLSRDRIEEARAVSERTGIPLDEAPPVAAPAGGRRERVGFAGLFSGGNALPAILLGFMSVLGLVLVYAINT